MIIIGGKLLRIANISAAVPGRDHHHFTEVLMVDGTWIQVEMPFAKFAAIVKREEES